MSFAASVQATSRHSPERTTLSLALFVVLLFCARWAFADFGAAISAYLHGDYATALHDARAAAADGNGDASLLLGDMYSRGQGVTRDPVMAYAYYQRAVSAGVDAAQAPRDALAKSMTPAQLATARARAHAGGALVSPASQRVSRETVRDIQRALARLGYQPGPADGLPGQRTRAAVEHYQHDHGLPMDGALTPALAARLDAGGGATMTGVMVTARATPLRAAPDTAATVVSRLAPGTRVLTEERRGEWVRVRLLSPAGGEGWLTLFTLVDVSAAPQPARVTAPAASGGGFFSSLARGVAGLLGGSTSREPASGTTATIGVRGFGAGALTASRPDPAELRRMEGLAVSVADARAYARAGHLHSHRIPYLPSPAPPPAAVNAAAPEH